MPAEPEALLTRPATVVAVAAGTVRLRLAPSCDGCGACAGRCRLPLDGVDGDCLELADSLFQRPPVPGQTLSLALPRRQLLQRAALGYGVPLAGLVLGTLLGATLAARLGLDADIVAVAGAMLGTLLGVTASKRTMPVTWRIAVDPTR